MATIITKNSSTAGAAPTAGDLVQGELAVNVTDKALYTENASGTVVKLNTPSIVDNGNATAITIDSSENVGVGVTPSAWWSSLKAIDVNTTGGISGSTGGISVSANGYYNGTNWIYKTSSYSSYYEQGAGKHMWFTAASGTAGNAITFTQAMTLDSTGYLGLGVNSPQYWFDVRAVNLDTSGFNFKSTTGTNAAAGRFNNTGGNFYIGLDNSAGNRIGNNGAAYAGAIWHEGAYPLIFGTSNAERARIDSSGNLLVGTTTPGTASTGFTAYGSGIMAASTSASPAGYFNRGSDGTVIEFRRSNSTVGSISITTTATAYNTSSDYRLKDITGPITGTEAKNFIMALQPKQGTWKLDGSPFAGFVAHEFQEVSPSSVSGVKDAVDEDGKPIMQAMQASSPEVMANIVAFIQEQQAIIEQLKADVAALKAA